MGVSATAEGVRSSWPHTTGERGRPRLRRVAVAGLALAVASVGVFTAGPASAAPTTNRAVVWGGTYLDQTAVPSSLDGKTITALSAGDAHSLALTDDGTVTAWGGNYSGQTDVPSSMSGRTATAVSAGQDFSLALTDDGAVTAWGRDDNQQSTVPASLSDKTVTAIAGGGYHSLALTQDGTVVGWGYGGTGATTTPTSLVGKTVTAISAGGYHSLALTSDGKVTAWGYNGYGQNQVPASLDEKTVTAIDGGLFFSMALTSDGTVTAWGDDSAGQTQVPVELAQKTVVAISAGARHAMALTSDGEVFAWGSNDYGVSDVPQSLAGQDVTTIAAGYSHSAALVSSVTLTSTGSPTIAGTPTVGETLTATPPEYDAEPDSVSYQWRADGEPIDGATGSTLELAPAQAGATITVETTAKRAGYTTVRDVSAPTAAVAKATFTTGPTAAITGTPVVDGTLTADAGTPQPAAGALGYRWFADGEPVDGATESTLALSAALLDATITVEVTATRAGYTPTSDLSDGVGPVDEATFTDGPTAAITGTPVVGATLNAGGGTITPVADGLTYRWFADGDPVADATDATLVLTPALADQKITVEVTAARAGYTSASDVSDPSEPVERNTFSTALSASVSGDAVVGNTLSAVVADAPPEADELTYQWLADGEPIAGATGTTLDLTPALAGTRITVTVTAAQPGYTTFSDTSDEFGPVDTAAFSAGPVASITGTPVVGETLTADAGDVTPEPDSVTYRWSADGERIAGATGATLDLTPALAGTTITVTVTVAKVGYTTASDTSDGIGPVDEATFTTGPTAGITGNPVVGSPLTAAAGTTTPAADRVSYQWRADDQEIADATGPVFVPSPAQVGKALTVEVTASRDGYVPASDVSDEVGPVTAVPAPPAPPAAPVPAPSAPTAPAARAGTVYSKTGTGGVTLTGTGVAGATITVREGARVVGTAKVGTNRRWSLAVKGLSTGRHTFSATQTVGGRTSTAGAAGSITVTKLKVRIAKAVSPTAAKRPVVRGRGNAGATIVVRTTAGRKLGTTKVRADGSWTLRTTKLKRGTYKVRATQTIAGQTIRSSTIRFRTTARS